MENPDLKLSSKDYAIRVTKGALSAVPFVGGLLGEMLEIAVYPQQQKKLNEWFEYVDTTLNQLIEQGAKTKEQIFNDEEFLSIFQKTSRIYTSNVEQHKKPILQAYLKASLIKQVPLDKKYIFLKIIDELTETQILILRDIYDREKSNYSYDQSQLRTILADKYTNGDGRYLELFIKGLIDFSLIYDDSYWGIKIGNITEDFFEYLSAE